MYESVYIYYDSVLMYVKVKTLPRFNAALRSGRSSENRIFRTSEVSAHTVNCICIHYTTQHS